MGDLPVKLGPMDALPPAIRYRAREALRLLPRDGGPLEGIPLERLARLVEDGEPWLGADPALAEVGAWMLDARHAVELRRRGCIWLAMFPSVDAATRLAKVALDDASPRPVREQAIWALGDRQLRARHPATRWPVEAVQLADEALVKLAEAATAAGKVASEQLPLALRSVSSEGAAAVFARAPALWGEALECHASPALARVLLVCLDDLAPQHRLRVIRLIGSAIGDEAVPMLRVRAAHAAPDEKLELLYTAIGLGGEAQLGAFEDALRGTAHVELSRQRARWHLQHPGVVPTVRGLKIARSAATVEPVDRAHRCAEAADDLGVLTRFARHPEAYLYTMWGWMVRAAGDPARARELVAAHPESQRLVRDLYFEDLARRGRVKQLVAAAQMLQGADLGAMLLAIWGRPIAALELAATARLHTPELVFARALACYRAGRPDLTDRILAEDAPPAEIVDDDAVPTFPGPHERWLIEHAAGARPAIHALAGGRAGVIAIARPAPSDADPDTPSVEPVGAIVRRLGRGLAGATVYLAGELKYADKDKIIAAVTAAGGRLVNGPFPGTDYYVHGEGCPVHTVAQLERQGARRLGRDDLEGL